MQREKIDYAQRALDDQAALIAYHESGADDPERELELIRTILRGAVDPRYAKRVTCVGQIEARRDELIDATRQHRVERAWTNIEQRLTDAARDAREPAELLLVRVGLAMDQDQLCAGLLASDDAIQGAAESDCLLIVKTWATRLRCESMNAEVGFAKLIEEAHAILNECAGTAGRSTSPSHNLLVECQRIAWYRTVRWLTRLREGRS